MKKVHCYITRSHDRGFSFDSRYKNVRYKLLCTRKWEDEREDTDYRTAMSLITCPDCLKILIEKKEKELTKMKENLRDACDRFVQTPPEGVPPLPEPTV